jgi:hypothetical protein
MICYYRIQNVHAYYRYIYNTTILLTTLYLQQSNTVVKSNLQLRAVPLKGHKSI